MSQTPRHPRSLEASRRLAWMLATVALAGCAAAPTAAPSVGFASIGAPSTAAPSVAASAAEAPTPQPVSPSTATSSAPTSSLTPEPTMSEFVLTSTSFEPGGSIPTRYTCDGADVSPELSWSGAPSGAAALVLLVSDPDARDFVHWIVLDMTGTASGALPRGIGTSPDAPAQGRNDFGRIGWGGPCPPSGTHRYTFTIYALAAPLALPGQPDGRAVRRALDGVEVLGTAVLEGRYRRTG